MLKLIKSKAFKVAGLVIAMAMMLAATASAATTTTVSASAFNYSGKMTQGMSGPGISTLQAALNSVNTTQIIVDGDFGPATCKAVKEFQSAHMLTADCIVGPMTGAALAAATVAVITVPTTETLCPNGMTLASNCTTAPSTTPAQALCPNGMTLASNCMTAPTTGGVLTGGAGDINISSTSTDVEDQVLEGESNTKVLGFKIEANGSDVNVTNVKVSLKNQNTGTASYRLTNVASEVSVWMGSTKVGSALVSDFSKDTTTNGGINVYSKSIALNSALVKMGSNNKQTFYVAVTALGSIDSTDMTNDNWSVFVNNVRFQDGTGVVMTSSSTVGSETSGTFEFADLAASGNAKVVVSKGSASPITQNVTVSTTGSTKDLMLLEFKVKTTGSTASFDSLNITTSLTTAGSADTYSTIVGELTLKDGSGNTLDTIDGSALDGTETFSFDETKTVGKDTTETFHVYATILDDSNFTSGAVLTASFASFSPEDSNGGIITDTGSATGSAQTFVYNVPTIALAGTPTLALFAHTDGTTSGLEDSYLATISFNITAPESAAVYVPLDSFSYATAGTAGVLFTKTGGATVTSTTVQYAGNDNLLSITEGSSYRIDAGTTQKFTLSVYLTGNDVAGKIAMTGLWYELSNTTPNGSPLVTGLTNLYTPLVYLAK